MPTEKERVERLIADGRMTGAGLALIEAAKENGWQTIFDEIEVLVIPDDLAAQNLMANHPKGHDQGSVLPGTD